MSFIFPTFLFALFAVLIPVIIHLFNFRTYKTVYFSNVQFLKNVKKETKSRSNLKHLLILLMRILTIASIVFAFSGPYIPSEKQLSAPSLNIAGIYIDNSFSTQAESKYGKILETEKKKALEIAGAYPEDTKFLFLTNDFDLKHQHLVSKEQLKDFILNTNLSPDIRKASSVISKMESILKNSGKAEGIHSIYYFSDFQKTSSDLNEIKTDSSTNIIFIPVLPEKKANLYIDSLWFEDPNRPLNQIDELNFSITNASEKAYTQMPVKLYINDSLKSTGSFNVEAYSKTSGKISFTNDKTGTVKGKVEISDFPITFDNHLYFSYTINKTNKILIIKDDKTNDKYIKTVFSGLKNVYFKIVSPQNLNTAELNNYNVVISDGLKKISSKLKEDLLNFTEEGGTLIIFPVIHCNINSYNNFFNEADLNYITGFDTSKTEVGKINYKSDILKNVFKKKEKNIDLPYVLKRINFSNLTNIDEDVILYSEKNDKLLFSSDINNGKVFVFAQNADASSGNLVFHPIWVSLLYNMVFYNSAGKNIYYTIGNDFAINLNSKNTNTENIFHIVNKNKNIDIIPQFVNTEKNRYKLFINNTIREAGYYTVLSGNDIVGGIALNYNRAESNLDGYSLKEPEKLISEFHTKNFSVLKPEKEILKDTILNKNRGIPLNKLFLILALGFIALEILLIKFLK